MTRDAYRAAEMLSEEETQLLVIVSRAEMELDDIIDVTGWPHVKVTRFLLWLENKGLVLHREEEFDVYVATETGRHAVKNGLPERRLLEALKDGPLPLGELMGSLEDRKAGSAAFGQLKKEGIIEVNPVDGEKLASLASGWEDTVTDLEAREKALGDAVKEPIEERAVVPDLVRRSLLKKNPQTIRNFTVTDLGKEAFRERQRMGDLVGTLTSESLQTGSWKDARFRRYDIEASTPRPKPGRKHPLRIIMEDVRDIFVEMGFVEMNGPWVELAFWNMDSMFIPQDHPARDVQDTFYLEEPKRGRLPQGDLIPTVKRIQEDGGDTGSSGWEFPWSPEVASQLLLRTHTTAVTYRTLAAGIDPPVKRFCIGKVFRNEAIDRWHLPEFHQIEGYVAAPGLTFRNLLGYLKIFYEKMGFKKLRFKPTYNPYTEPSMEIFAYHEPLKTWIEVGNSGIFRPESLAPYGVKVPVVAWGLAVERIGSFAYDNNDIRELVGHTCKLPWLKQYPVTVRGGEP